MESDLKPYQDRMKPFVLVGILYSMGFLLWTFFVNVPSTNWMIFASTLALFVAMAVGFDAVFDSLRERLPPHRHEGNRPGT